MDETWKSDLDGWLAPFLGAFRHKTRARMCPVYVAGLIGVGDRKSVQPMAARDGEVSYDQLHHFIASGVWDAAPLDKALLIEADRMVGGADAWLIVENSVEILDPDWLTWLELRRRGADLERVGFRNANPAESLMIKGLASLPSALLNRRPRPKSRSQRKNGPPFAPRCPPDAPRPRPIISPNPPTAGAARKAMTRSAPRARHLLHVALHAGASSGSNGGGGTENAFEGCKRKIDAPPRSK
jgi:hypothetical protein